MSDKEKRLRKILVKKGLKGRLKLVPSLDDAHLVYIENIQCHTKSMLIGKDTYSKMLERGNVFPDEIVFYLVSTNPRNMYQIEQQFLLNAFGSMKPVPK